MERYVKTDNNTETVAKTACFIMGIMQWIVSKNIFYCGLIRNSSCVGLYSVCGHVTKTDLTRNSSLKLAPTTLLAVAAPALRIHQVLARSWKNLPGPRS